MVFMTYSMGLIEKSISSSEDVLINEFRDNSSQTITIGDWSLEMSSRYGNLLDDIIDIGLYVKYSGH